jgi:sec-independent protein translocase protein TatA
MGGLSIWHWIIVIAVVAVVFGGKGKISGIMGDLAHGIRNFKDGLKDPVKDPLAETPGVIADKRDAADIKKAEEVKHS